MKKLLRNLVILSLFFINCTPSLAFDFAPEIGDLAPNFVLEGINNSVKSKKEWELNDFKGKWLVLYFYPKDFTAGCTIEAKSFTELKVIFQNLMQKLLVLVQIIKIHIKVSVVKNQ